MRYLCFLILALLSVDAYGQSWKRLPHSPLGILDVADDTHLMVFRADTIALSDDGGLTWYFRSGPKITQQQRLTSAKRISDSEIIVYGGSNANVPILWRSLDTGSTYQAKTIPSLVGCAYLADVTPTNWYYGIGYDNGDSIRYTRIFSPQGEQLIDGGLFHHNDIMYFDVKDSVAACVTDIRNSDIERYEYFASSNFRSSEWEATNAAPDLPGRIRAGPGKLWFGVNMLNYLRGNATLFRSGGGPRFESPFPISNYQFKDSLLYICMEEADYIYSATVHTPYGNYEIAPTAASLDNVYGLSSIFLPSDSVGYAQGVNGIVKLNARSATSGPVLHVKRVLDFGKISRDSVIDLQIDYSNVGNSVLTLTSPMLTSSNFLDVHLSAMQLLRGEGGTLSIKYKLQSGVDDRSYITLPTNTTTGDELIEVRAQLKAQALVCRDARSSVLEIFPNPASNSLTLRSEAIRFPAAVEICDAVGRSMLIDRACQGLLDVSVLPRGIYWVSMTDLAGSTARAKFVR